ncbi:hypothetical protein H2203_001359 [Taxawa tesnikishii (nom. ined.)]|nr:hypothetical protein H2203_001359 [Dothideales sp. JES 119]
MASNYGQNDWMSNIIDSTPLNAINLVGTYRSQYGDASPLEQLNRGIRFFDLRLSGDGSFLNFVGSVAAFLADHKSEFVLIQIKHELGWKADFNSNKSTDWLRIFQNALQDFKVRSAFIYTGDSPAHKIPLSQVRGRAVLLADNDMRLGYAFDSPLTVDPKAFWPVSLDTQITTFPSPDPSTWGNLDAIDSPWDRVNSALQLSINRTNIAFGMTWLATETASGNKQAADYFSGGIAQVLTHGSNPTSAPAQGFWSLGLIVMDNISFNQDVIAGIIKANQSVKHQGGVVQ